MTKAGLYSTVNAAGDFAELHILDDIGPSWAGMVGAKGVAAELKAIGKVGTVKVKMNSLGGSVFEGVTIYNLLKDHPAQIEIQVMGIAASIASIISMAGDRVVMSAGSYMMIHNPWGIAVGESGDLRKQADVLDMMGNDLAGIYADKTGKTADYFKDLMTKETWFTPEEAVAAGLAHEVAASKTAVVNSLTPRGYTFQNAPKGLRKTATLAAKLNARIREIDCDQMSDRTSGNILNELHAAKVAGLDVDAVLSGQADCQADDALQMFAKVLGIPVDDLRTAHAGDGCTCKPSSRVATGDHRSELAAWKLLANQIGK